MKKRVPALLLLFALALNMPALAATDSSENFVRSQTYAGEFSDLAADSVFFENVSALYEYGLSVGREDGTFGLDQPMTVGQAVIFAGRIRSLYRTGDAEAGPDAFSEDGEDSAPGRYFRYLKAEGVLAEEWDGQLDHAATRAQTAHVLAGVLPEGELPPINDSLVTQGYASRRFITDVTEYTPYQQDILTLYRAGVCAGTDAAGSFLPDAPITRGAAAAMLTRLVDPSLRLTLTWELSEYPFSAEGATLAGLVPSGSYVESPATDKELEDCIRHMLSAGSGTLTLRYPGISAMDARRVMERALTITKTYCEQSYNSVSCTYNQAGSVTLTFSALDLGENIARYREETMAAAIAVHDRLWAEGALTSAMTEYEKARVYYTWICDNTTYDYSAGETSYSHIPHNLFYRGLAVCDGYTGAYNLLLKLEGIECTALSNASHIWTVATLDGTLCHIDTTWGDSGSSPNEAFFAMTPEESWAQHAW